MEFVENVENMTNKSISVCLASYNGGLFIKEQIESVLSQLNNNDELIIVDDCSNDDTISIVKNINDSRIVLFENKQNLGACFNFERAINESKGDYIFLADQDDIWNENRVNIMIDALKKNNVLLVSGNQENIDKNGNPIIVNKLYSVNSDDSKHYTKNILKIFLGKISYYGCCMAFKRELIKYIIPFPKDVVAHDVYIAMFANVLKSNVHLNDIVTKRRLHGSNVTNSNRRLYEKIKTRFIFLNNLKEINQRIKYVKRGF